MRVRERECYGKVVICFMSQCINTFLILGSSSSQLSLLNCVLKGKDSYPLKIHLMEPLQKLTKVSPIYRDLTSIVQILGKIKTMVNSLLKKSGARFCWDFWCTHWWNKGESGRTRGGKSLFNNCSQPLFSWSASHAVFCCLMEWLLFQSFWSSVVNLRKLW